MGTIDHVEAVPNVTITITHRYLSPTCLHHLHHHSRCCQYYMLSLWIAVVLPPRSLTFFSKRKTGILLHDPFGDTWLQTFSQSFDVNHAVWRDLSYAVQCSLEITTNLRTETTDLEDCTCLPTLSVVVLGSIILMSLNTLGVSMNSKEQLLRGCKGSE